VPDSTVPGTLHLAAGKLLVRRLQFLQADDIRLRLGKPAQQHLEAAVDAVDVVGGELHRFYRFVIALVTLTGFCVVFGVVASVSRE
jgi:hypothetical protein